MRTENVKLLIAFIVFSTGIACNSSSENKSIAEKPAAVSSEETSSTERQKKIILFFGNSLTAAYGLESHESFPSLIQTRLDSLGHDYEVINAGVSGETTATGSNRVKWVVERQPIDIFVLELGANDGLRGVPVEETQRNLEKIIDLVREVYPNVKILLAGMMIPPSMGPEYSMAFGEVFANVASSKNVSLIPFLLEDVAGIDSLNLPDGIHPNAQGQKIVAENVWREVEKML